MKTKLARPERKLFGQVLTGGCFLMAGIPMLLISVLQVVTPLTLNNLLLTQQTFGISMIVGFLVMVFVYNKTKKEVDKQ